MLKARIKKYNTMGVTTWVGRVLVVLTSTGGRLNGNRQYYISCGIHRENQGDAKLDALALIGSIKEEGGQ